jgi:phosphoribosylformylglycinamidine (FGAM) synthase-like enzyme
MQGSKNQDKGLHVPINMVEIEIPGCTTFHVPITGGKFSILHRTRKAGTKRYTAEVTAKGLRTIKPQEQN